MKCDLCKRETKSELLCESCAEAIHRLVVISNQPAAEQQPLAMARGSGS